MKRSIRTKYLKILVILFVVISNVFFTQSADAASITIKNLYFSLTYPATVKMPKGNCGSFTVSYAKGLKLLADTNKDGTPDESLGQIFAGVTVDGEMAAGSYWTFGIGDVGLQLKNKGTVSWKFCKQDWVDGTDERRGIGPGVYTVSFYGKFRFDEVEKSGTIKFIK